jgi:hypothetical protein
MWSILHLDEMWSILHLASCLAILHLACGLLSMMPTMLPQALA